jgi:uncharacterized protein (TIGR03118 family)
MITSIHFDTTRRRTALAALFCAASALSACNYGGNGRAPTPPTVSLAISPTSIVLGTDAMLTWTSDVGASCAASNGWSGSQAATGTQSVTPTSTGDVTFTLTCAGDPYRGARASASSTVVLKVLPASAFSATSLVSDVAGTAARVKDAALVNPWGIAFGPATAAWMANNRTDTATLHDGSGRFQPSTGPLTVTLPASTSGAKFGATGLVFNGTSSFVVTSGDKSGAARFVFAGQSGMIAGWSPAVNATNAIKVYEDAAGAAYTGLAIANTGSADVLYAVDFAHGRIDTFDAAFVKLTPSSGSFAFTDPALPAGFVPFGVQALKTGASGAAEVYVTYARRRAAGDGVETAERGAGVVDVFDTKGVLIRRLAGTGGKLDAPWGVALAPSDFGTLSGAVLVGNFGDGTVHGFDAASGRFLGTLSDGSGRPFAAAGLWGIGFGNGNLNQPRNALFYAAGVNGEADGEYGRIDLGSAPTLGPAPVVTMAPVASPVAGTIDVTATIVDDIAVDNVEFFAGTRSIGVARAAPFTVRWDTKTVANGAVAVTATATDANRNVGSSAASTIVIANP